MSFVVGCSEKNGLDRDKSRNRVTSEVTVVVLQVQNGGF